MNANVMRMLTMSMPFDRAKNARGGSGWLDSLCQFISGAWRIADYAAVSRVVRWSA